MKAIRDRVAGLDVHKDSVVACAQLRQGAEVAAHKRRFGTTTAQVAELAEWLADLGVTTVAMEATGVYWKPIYYGLEGLFEELWLCNAQHVKNVPGRKTDMADAEWLADVAAHGMVRPSVVPEPAMREVRELTRYRKSLVDERVREIQRLEKELQDAGIKLSSVASRLMTKSGRAMVEALIRGERDPKVLADLAQGKMREKIPPWNRPWSGGSVPTTPSSPAKSWPMSTSWTPRWPSSTKPSGSAWALLRARSACSWRWWAGAGARPRSFWPRRAGTWPGSPRPSTWRLGAASARPTTSRRASTRPCRKSQARPGSGEPSSRRPRPPPAPTAPISAPSTARWPAGAAPTKRPWPWPIPWSSPPGTSSPPVSTTTTSGPTSSVLILTRHVSRNANWPTCAISGGPSPLTQTAPSPSHHPI